MKQARARSTKKLNAIVFAAALTVIVGSSNTVQAHPGHGVNPDATATDPVHYLTEPVHALPILALAGFFAARWYRAAKQERAEAGSRA